MVIAVLFMVLIMLVDRIIYANYSFEQEELDEKKVVVDDDFDIVEFRNPNEYKVCNSAEDVNYEVKIDEKMLDLEG